MKKTVYLFLFPFFYFLFSSITFAQGKGVLCQLECIQGTKDECTKAKSLFKNKETQNPALTEVFITKKQVPWVGNKDCILFFTNYKNFGADHPIKILWEIDNLKKQNVFSLDDLLYNCNPNLLKRDIEYIIDESFYKSSYFKKLFGKSPQKKYKISIATKSGKKASLNNLLKVKKQHKKIQTFLDDFAEIGFEDRTLDDVKRYYRQQYGNDLSLSDIYKKLVEDYNQRVHYKYNQFKHKYVSYIRSKTFDGLLYTDSRYVRANLDAIEASFSNIKLTDNNFEFLNFLDKMDDSATFREVNKLFPNNHTNVLNDQDILFIEEKIRNKGIKYIFPLGHWNSKSVVTYIDGVMKEFSIDILKKLAKKHGVKIIPIGCKSSFATGLSGTTINVNSFEIIQKLFESLKDQPSIASFLGNFTEKSKKYTFVFDIDVNQNVSSRNKFLIKVYPEGTDVFNRKSAHVVIDLSDVVTSIPLGGDEDEEDEGGK